MLIVVLRFRAARLLRLRTTRLLRLGTGGLLGLRAARLRLLIVLLRAWLGARAGGLLRLGAAGLVRTVGFLGLVRIDRGGRSLGSGVLLSGILRAVGGGVTLGVALLRPVAHGVGVLVRLTGGFGLRTFRARAGLAAERATLGIPPRNVRLLGAVGPLVNRDVIHLIQANTRLGGLRRGGGLLRGGGRRSLGPLGACRGRGGLGRIVVVVVIAGVRQGKVGHAGRLGSGAGRLPHLLTGRPGGDTLSTGGLSAAG
ncbi:hypothetical protein AGDE_14350 [Angomonas deanei]|nr:hypothetical protein AGDE_14350 [Angomonas deanei]|eukprot:EPY20978.1 hypothetical protein AGDE_14350 [Angomonas deanei]